MSFKDYLSELNKKSEYHWLTRHELDQDNRNDQLHNQAVNDIRKILNNDNIEAIIQQLLEVIRLQDANNIEARKLSINKLQEIQSYLTLIKDNFKHIVMMLGDKI